METTHQTISFYLNCNMHEIDFLIQELKYSFPCEIELNHIYGNVNFAITASFYSIESKIIFDNVINKILIVNNSKIK